MRIFLSALFFVPIFFVAPKAGAHLDAEFDKGRFKHSTFSCSNNTACNFGTCVVGMCRCQYGYRDSTEAACDHAMLDPDKTTAWALEAGLGWLFPAGWAYLNIWPTALARLAIELTSAGMTFGYFWERNEDSDIYKIRQENFNALGYFMGANLFGIGHIAAWIYSAVYLSQFDIQQTKMSKDWHKDQGFADLVVLADKVQDSLRITQNNFEADSCTLIEECVDGPGERRLLRFDAYIMNIGDSDFVMGLEEVSPVWSDCHQHFHGPDTANYFIEHKLLHSNGTVFKTIKRGHKQGYCYIDSNKINSTYKGKFGCGIPYFTKQLTQGITAGWADLYDSETDCQWIDITGLAAGNYTLSVTVNPRGIYYQDANLTNNLSVLKIEIPEVNKKVERAGYGKFISSTILQGPRS